MSNPASKQPTYIPTLDGCRALSISLVIMHHSQVQYTVPVLGPLLKTLADFGDVGVEIFFDEESRFGHINVKGFYSRGFFRILPAAIFYLLVVAILAVFHLIPLLSSHWFGALLFFGNYTMVFEYLRHSPLALHWYTKHFWFLSKEVHFYPVLPRVLIIFRGLGLSHTLYLWRQLFSGVNFVGSPRGPAVIRKSPINLTVLFVCATFSHYVIEKAFVRLGHTFAPTSIPRHRLGKAALPTHPIPSNRTVPEYRYRTQVVRA